MKEKILYVSNSSFPNMASGIRVKNLGTLLETVDYDVVYYSINDFKDSIPVENLNKLNLIDCDRYVKFNLDNNIHYFNKNKQSKIRVLLNYKELFTNNEAVKNIKKICEEERINRIILYNPYYNLTKKIFNYCKKKKIDLIIDNTEWYEIDKNKDFASKFVAKSVNKRILKLDRKINRIISISPWMNKWYNERNINGICIMPLMNTFIEPIKNVEKETINIVYCGIPGTKDLLIPFIEEIIKLNNNRIRLDIIGVKSSYFAIDNLEKYNIYCHGRIAHEEVAKFYAKADFSCLFRKNLIYAKAGFSTKVAESLSFGVPILCNVVGGTDDIITTKYNGMKIEKFESDYIKEMLLEILNMNDTDLFEMKNNSYKTANKLFKIENYVEDIRVFLK